MTSSRHYPSRGTARVALAGLLALCLACAADERQPGPRAEVVGVVVDVQGAGLGEVESFSLKRGDRTLEIFIDPRADYSFPPAHLHDHLASSQPVRVETEERDGRLVALAIEDA